MRTDERNDSISSGPRISPFFFSKQFQVDETGFPVVDGLMKLYNEGVQDRNYYMATLSAVRHCISIAQQLKQQLPHQRFGNLKHFRYTLDTLSMYSLFMRGVTIVIGYSTILCCGDFWKKKKRHVKKNIRTNRTDFEFRIRQMPLRRYIIVLYQIVGDFYNRIFKHQCNQQQITALHYRVWTIFFFYHYREF